MLPLKSEASEMLLLILGYIFYKVWDSLVYQ